MKCASMGPHGLLCAKEDGHRMTMALSEAMHRDGHGNEWLGDIPVATPLSTWTPPVWRAPPPVVAPTVTAMAAKCMERLATLDRVRPILNQAIKDAKPEDVAAWAIVAVRVSEAILRDGGR